MLSGGDHFLLRHRQRVQEGLHRGFAEAPSSLMWPRLVIFLDPRIQIGLEFVDRTIHLFSKRDTVELIQHGLWKRSQMPLVCGLLVLVRV